MFLSPYNTASQFQFRNYKLVKLQLPSFPGLSCSKMVTANPRLSMGCQDYYFTWFSDNHALNNIGQVNIHNFISQGTKCLFTLINSIISSGEK